MRHVAIIGLGAGMTEAPVELERWGLPWGGNSGYDIYFEVHSQEVISSGAWHGRETAYKAKLAELFVPVLMVEPFDDVDNCKPYPKDAVDLACGYIESSIGYMMAYAIHEDVDEVSIFGVGCPFDEHYAHQRANLEYLIGFARGRGIKVNIQPQSELLTSYWDAGIYGKERLGAQNGD